jgi:hypothetical protein
MHRSIKALALCSALLASAPAVASETIWLDSDNSPYGGYQGFGTALTFSGGGITATVTGWSVNNNDTINDGELGVWSQGIGVKNSSGDNSHTIDNVGWTDFIVLEFDQLVSLSDARFNTGWHGLNDTDATVGYMTAAPGSLSLDGASASSLSMFNPYFAGEGGASGNITRNINPGANVGNFWMISATTRSGYSGNDGFKLEGLRVNSAVPEPGTWAMLLVGFGLLGASMRRRRRQQQLAHFAF